MRVSLGYAGLRPLLAFVAAVGLVAAGCTLDKVEDPPLIGPSETGLSVELSALPDTLNADGVSQSLVQLVLRDSSGQPVSGRAILFCTTAPPDTTVVPECQAASGQLVAGAGSTFVGPVQSGIVMATDQNGAANVVWIAGTDRSRIYIGVRPYGIDAATGFLRTVEIFQQ
jgi:hypothetical protein